MRVAPASARAPMAILQAVLLAVAIAVSKRLALASAAFAKDEIQFCIPERVACESAVAHLCTSSFCCVCEVLASERCAVNALVKCPPSAAYSDVRRSVRRQSLATSLALLERARHMH